MGGKEEHTLAPAYSYRQRHLFRDRRRIHDAPSSYVGGSFPSNAADVVVSKPQRSISLNLYRMLRGFCMREPEAEIPVRASAQSLLESLPWSLRRIALLYKITVHYDSLTSY